ncbi:MAG TPA: hypothetical protein VH054_20660 [Polyangiaceae bacterium]|jgi:hypothetical protein|nr:hypothetical protein [Polyangiaceae bacterium]
MHRFFFCLLLVSCGGKIDTGDDGGLGLDSSAKDASSSDVSLPPSADATPPPSSQCTGIGGGTVADQNGCTVTETWSCGSTSYTVDCNCPNAQCTCSQESGGIGSGTVMTSVAGICPGCIGSGLAALCGFPH